MFRRLKFLFLIAALAATPAFVPPAHAAAGASPIDEGQFVYINGTPQWITVRGSDVHKPVLLLLHGGPGFAMSFLAPLYADWEKDFMLVQWDQPLSGGTYLKNLGTPTGPVTIDRYVTDGIAVAEWARHRLGVKKIVLVGTSWGSLIGLEMAHRRPDLFYAYVGAAQAVSPKGAIVGYNLALEAAKARGDSAGVAALTRVGPPPYTRFEDFLVRQQYSNAPGLPPTPAQAAAVGELMAVLTKPDPAAHYNAPIVPPPGYDGGLMAAQRATWQQTWSWDAHHMGTRFKVPVFVFQGDMDYNTPTSVARDYLAEIRAPRKGFELVPGAGHDVILFHAEVLKLLEKDVLPIVRAGRR